MQKNKEEIAKWNQMTALRFQTGGGGGGQPRPPFGVSANELSPLKMIFQKMAFSKLIEAISLNFSNSRFVWVFVDH